MSEYSGEDRFQDAAAATSFDMVRVSESLSVPTATPAVFEPGSESCRVAKTAAEIENALRGPVSTVDDEEIMLIAPHSVDAEDDDGVYVSGKVFVETTGEFARVKATSDTVCIFPTDDGVSPATVESVITAIETEQEIVLTFSPEQSMNNPVQRGEV